MNTTFAPMDLPPLPTYTLRPRDPLIPGISDTISGVLLPVIAYWAFSMLFHVIDVYDLFPQYRLHTPAEVLKRNHVSRFEVVRDVLIQQLVQITVGAVLDWFEPPSVTGMDDYNVAVWALRLRLAQRAIPMFVALAGLDAKALAHKAFDYSPSVAGALAGGFYPASVKLLDGASVPAFTTWEIATAKLIYWVLVPALQFLLAIVLVDTWQYFLHRGMHMNKWLYTTFHARHHRLYVPYAYGALYNHPVEGFVLDTCGTGLAYLLAGMTPRQGICFFVGSTFKTIDDHCGYSFPWDPLQHLTSNNAGYHDVHHQSWGIKTNFSQPFSTFWDRLLGTTWTGGDVSARYDRARRAAEKSLGDSRHAGDITASKPLDSILADTPTPYSSPDTSSPTTLAAHTAARPAIPAGKATAQALDSRAQILSDRSSSGGPGVLLEETAEEEREAARLLRRSPRKRAPGQQAQQVQAASGLMGLKERVTGGGAVSRGRATTGHGGRGKVLGYEH